MVNNNDTITLPRSVVEQTLDAMTDTALGAKVFGPKVRSSLNALRAALKHPDAGPPATAPEGWRLVPVVPTREMIEAGKDAHYEAEKRIQEPDAWSPGGFAKRAVRATHVFQAMLAAAPHPPEHYDQQALDLCPTCGWKTMIPGDCCLICARQKPQVEQEHGIK